MKKRSSLLDYSYPGLSPDIWQADGTLLPYHKDYILKLITSFYETYKFKDPTAWVKDITNVGSLTTNKYLRTSDFDCHIVVDLKQFQKTNMPDVSVEEAALYLDNARKEWDRAKILLPFGEHPLELYFESELSPSNTKAVGRYSLVSNSWLKEPVFFAQDEDYEQSKHKIIEEAIQMANDLDASFGNIRRDIQRIDELKQVAQAWPVDTRNFYMEKIQGKLDAIEEEIEKAVALQQALIDERHQKQDPFSENEIKFKYLARFFYFYVISELKDLMKKTDGEVTETELPAIKKIVTEAAKDPQATETDICIDFDHTIAEGAKYPAIGEPITGAKESLAKLKEMGYNIIIYTCRGDSKEGTELVREWLDKHEMSYDSIFQGEKPFAKYYIDDRAIRFDSWDSVLTQVGKSNKKASASVLNVEPYEGGVEFRVLVNPTRSQVARSLQQAKYQELRVIQGNNSYIWDAGKATHEHVLMYLVDQGLEEYSGVQTGYVLDPTDIDEFTWKNGSLLISAAQWPAAFWISSDGQKYEALTHDVWMVNNAKLLKQKYNFDLSQYDQDDLFDAVNDLVRSGWTRVSISPNGKDYMAEVADVRNVPTTAIDILLSSPSNSFLFESPDSREPSQVTKEELAGGQEEITRNIKRANRLILIHKVAYSPIGTNKYWIDPSGKSIKIGTSEMHIDWIAHNLGYVQKSGVDVSQISDPKMVKKMYYDDLDEGQQNALDHIMSKMQMGGGWVRVTSDSANTQFDIDAGSAGFTPGVDQFIAEHFNPNIGNPIGVSWKGGEYLEIYDPFPTLAQAYKKAARSGRRASLEKDAAYNHAYWIDPNGKIFEVRGAEGNESSPSSTHHKWVNRNVDMLRNEYGIVPTKSEYGENLGTKELLDKGWVRIGDGYNADWGITVQDINNIPTTVDNALAQFAPEGSEITIEDNKWENAVLFQWPVNSVQKAVQQALRRRKENPAFQPALAASQLPLSKREIKALNPYGDDSLKQGPAYAIFEHTQKGLPEFNVPDIQMYTILGDSPLFGSTVAEGKLQELGIPIRQTKQAQTKKVKQGEYGAVMALIPHDVAQDVVAWGVRNIPDDKVYSNPDNPRLGRELESHITIKYGLQTEDAKSVRRFFNESKPFKAKLGKVRHFQPPEIDFDVVTVEIISEDLDKMNAEVTKEFDCAEGLASDVYHPHITVSYVKRDTGKDYVGSTEFEGIEVELDTIIFSPAKGNRTYFSISHDKEGAFHIEQIRKNAYHPGNWAESAWISPTGKVEEFEGDSHEDMIYELMDDPKIYDQEDPNSYAISKGWTRFGEMGGGGETGANVQSLRNINPAVFNHAMKYTGQNKEMVVADLSGAYVHLPVDEFVLGQNAVNKALQQKRMQGSLKKRAGYDIGYWVDPSGNVYDCHAEGLVHNEWILANLEMLQDKYGLEIPNYLMRESVDYFKAMETGEEDNFDQPSSDEVWDQMLKTGWARVGDADDGLGLEVLDIRNVPAHMDSLIGQDLHDGDVLRVDDIKHNSVAIQYPFKNIQQAVNKALQQKRMGKQAAKVEDVDGVRVYINPSQEELAKLSKSFHQEFMNLPSVRALIDNRTGDIYAWDGWFQEHTTMKKNLGLESASHWDGGSDDLSHLYALQEDMRHSSTNKTADFLPSLVQAPDNDWQFAGGGDDKEIPVDPDGQSDEQTNMAPCTTGKPRKDQMWRELWHMIKSPFSKKDKEAAADTEQEQIEKDELGEDETLLEYSKHFKDLNRFNTNKPKTTWDAGPSKAPNQQEPYSPLPVTLDVVTNPANENWRYPWRFTRRPIGDQSNQGEVTMALEHMLENLASLQKTAGQVTRLTNPEGQEFRVFKNPSPQQAEQLFNKSEHRALRFVGTGIDVYMWDAFFGEHYTVMEQLGIVDEGHGGEGAVFSPGQASSVAARFYKPSKTSSLEKQAYGQSNSVPDYLMDEWKTDQIHDDVDSEPYVNHDQRDYPYGMHDSPENTHSNIGWAKDNEPYVVRLDQIEKPFNRKWAPGLPEYQVFFFDTMPMSDGSEI